MAYSSVRVQFEIGHEASIRTKKTPEGFTHDWEVFVRGADNTDIQYFVDKVVFHLHETFPKPRRVTKEPPYVVKESGYAGFVLPIDVYLKNKEEPKKISFQYDLTLQQSGPPVSRVLREPRLFQNPSEDFRRKLIRGGGVGVDTPSEAQSEDLKTAPSSGGSNKAKIVESPVKKHKSDTSANHSFAELFGTPIRRVVEPKKLPEVPKKISELDLVKDKKKGSKHGTYREEKETGKDKDRYSEKDRIKERDRNKEKLGKRPPSPPGLPPQSKPKEEHKKYEEKEKKKEEHDDKKKRKEEKEKKEKTKEVREPEKMLAEKDHKKDKKDGEYAKKLNSSKPHDSKPIIEKPNIETIEKERPEKEKHKHRHKKKEKEKNREKDKHRKEKEKSEKEGREREKDKEKINKKRHEEGREKEEKVRKKSRSPSPVQERVKKGPLNALLDELGSSDSASPLSEEEPIPPFKPFSKPPLKIVPDPKPQPVNVTPKLKSTNINPAVEKESEKTTPKSEEPAKNKKEKSSSKKSKKSEKDTEKKKAKEEYRPRSPSTEKEEEADAEKERTAGIDQEEEKPKVNKDKENRKRKREKSEERLGKPKKNPENNRATTTEVPESLEEIRKSEKFTKEYVAQLKELQHRIMTLEDNAELQKVVNVIAETGQYEITNKTFDFDLCTLDFDTIKRLQEFFAPT